MTKQRVSFTIKLEKDTVIDDTDIEARFNGDDVITDITIEDIFICCLCDTETYGWSNNAEPLVKNGRCCKKCDNEKVIPERIRIHNG